MPDYIITDNDTGRKYRVTANSQDEAIAGWNKQTYGEGQPGFFSDPLGSMSRTGAHVRDAIMHPIQSVEDLARTSSNFVTFGGRDRLAPYLGSGRSYEDERAKTARASTRLGSIDEATNMATAAAVPSVAASSLPADAGVLRSAGAFGTE